MEKIDGIHVWRRSIKANVLTPFKTAWIPLLWQEWESEVGGPLRKVWVEVCCQGQTLLTLLKTKIVHLLPLLNQETLCYEPDSLCFTHRINNFLKMTSWNCSATHACLGQIREYPPPRIGIRLRYHVIKYQTLKQPVGYRDSKHRQYKTLCKATYMHFQWYLFSHLFFDISLSCTHAYCIDCNLQVKSTQLTTFMFSSGRGAIAEEISIHIDDAKAQIITFSRVCILPCIDEWVPQRATLM